MIDNRSSKIRPRYISVLIITLLALVQIFGIGPIMPISAAEAAPAFTVSPVAAPSSSLPVRVSVTASETAFTAGETTPYLMQNGSAVAANISSVTSTATKVSFTIGAGLNDGSYTIKVVSSYATYDNVGIFTVADPGITGAIPTSIAKNYDQQVSMTVTGQNTNWSLAQSVVEILDSNDEVVDKAGSVTAASASQLTFNVLTGLTSGDYKLRVTTGSEVVQSDTVFTVRGTPSVSLSKNSVTEGYDSTLITVTGTNTAFSDATTVSVLDENNNATGKVGTATVSSDTSLSFSLAKGLTAGDYTVKVTTGNEVATTALQVLTPTAVLTYQGNSFATLGAGYGSDRTIAVSGTNTNFAQGTTTVMLFAPDDADVTDTYVSNVSVSSAASASFTLAAGLDMTGTYTVRITTGDEIVNTSFDLVVPAISAFNISSGVADGTTLPKGYAETAVNVTATNSNFTNNTTVEVEGETGKVSGLTITDAKNLTFTLKSGLNAGSYTVIIDVDGNGVTGADEMTQGITVTAPSIDSLSHGTVINSASAAVTITVTGINTHFTVNTPVVDVVGVSTEQISDISVTDDTQFSFNIVPSSISSTGTYDVQVNISKASVLTETVLEADAITVKSSGISGISPGVIYDDQLGTEFIALVGNNTNFQSGTTKVKIDNGAELDSVEVSNLEALKFTVPAGLSEGEHTVWVDEDGNDDYEYSNTFTVSNRSINLSNNVATFNYDSFDMTISGSGVIFGDSYKPTVKILDNGQSVANISSGDVTVLDDNNIQFPYPIGLGSGSYTVQASWTDGDYDGITLEDTFDVIHDVSELYIVKGVSTVTSVTVTDGDQPFNMVLKGNLIGSGTEDKTSAAAWESSDTSVISVSDGQVTILAAGSATVSASYDGLSTTVEITVNAATTGGGTPGGGTPGGSSGSGLPSTPIITEPIEPELSIEDKDSAEEAIVAAGTYILSDNDVVVNNGKAQAEINIDQIKDKLDAAIAKSLEVLEKLQTDGVVVNKKLERKAAIEIPAIVGVNEVEAQLSADILDLASEKGIDKFEVKTSIADFRITSETFGSGAKGKNIKLAAGVVSRTALSAAAQYAVPSDAVVVDLNAAINEQKVSKFAKPMEVALPYTIKPGEDADAVTVFLLQDDGIVKPVGGKYNAALGKIVFRTNHFSKYFAKSMIKQFSDLSKYTWAEKQIEILAGKGIINGKAEGLYDPAADITRAEFSALLTRMLKLSGEGQMPFNDVSDAAWYTADVTAAYANGIVKGKSNTTFDPNGKITRQEMAVMISRVLSDSGYKDASKIELDIFKDKGKVASWAEGGIAMAVRESIVSGMPDGSFAPKENANRAEAAVMLYRLFKK